MPKFTFRRAAHGVFVATVEASSPEEALRIVKADVQGDRGAAPVDWNLDSDDLEYGELQEDFDGENGGWYYDKHDGTVEVMTAPELPTIALDVETTITPLSAHSFKAAITFSTRDLMKPITFSSQPEFMRNKEGLTLREWLRAANIGFDADQNVESQVQGSAFEAWSLGEDPTDWRAEGGNPVKL
jgi:hypothetical protein